MKRNVLKLCVLLTVGLFVFIGCASTPDTAMTAEERFDAIMQGTANMKYADSFNTIEMAVLVNDPSMPEPMTMIVTASGEALMDNSDSENPQSYLNVITEVMGSQVAMEMYYTNGTQYLNTMGMKIKTPIASDELSGLSDVSPMVMYASDMKSLEMEQKGSEYVFTFELSEESLEKYHEEISKTAQTMNTGSASDLTIGYFKGSLIGDKKNTIKTIMFETDMTISTDYNSINKPVKIDFPNFDDYSTEMPM